MMAELNRLVKHLSQMYKNMKKYSILLFLLLITSCINSTSEKNNENSLIIMDSVALTRYYYKIQGNNKTNEGDLKGGIEYYTKAITVDSLYDTAYFNRANNKMTLGD